ncbi:CLUMA_CG018775, isoform A [Clunio marinus]|uniref:CLUMA_CG018775, isoform A n=1 Tax=Clunio marinus TaxID=568069 RepID=A0A1J1J1D5_9DIPT|nr:CLUMA_CG018775, isoform A [Clunio marinus]
MTFGYEWTRSFAIEIHFKFIDFVTKLADHNYVLKTKTVKRTMFVFDTTALSVSSDLSSIVILIDEEEEENEINEKQSVTLKTTLFKSTFVSALEIHYKRYMFRYKGKALTLVEN